MLNKKFSISFQQVLFEITVLGELGCEAFVHDVVLDLVPVLSQVVVFVAAQAFRLLGGFCFAHFLLYFSI